MEILMKKSNAYEKKTCSIENLKKNCAKKSRSIDR